MKLLAAISIAAVQAQFKEKGAAPAACDNLADHDFGMDKDADYPIDNYRVRYIGARKIAILACVQPQNRGHGQVYRDDRQAFKDWLAARAGGDRRKRYTVMKCHPEMGWMLHPRFTHFPKCADPTVDGSWTRVQDGKPPTPVVLTARFRGDTLKGWVNYNMEDPGKWSVTFDCGGCESGITGVSVTDHPSSLGEYGSTDDDLSAGVGRCSQLLSGHDGSHHAFDAENEATMIHPFSQVTFYDAGGPMACGTFSDEGPYKTYMAHRNGDTVMTCKSRMNIAVNCPSSGASDQLACYSEWNCGGVMNSHALNNASPSSWTWIGGIGKSIMLGGECVNLNWGDLSDSCMKREFKVPGICMNFVQQSPFQPTCVKFDYKLADTEDPANKPPGKYHVHVEKVRFDMCITTTGHWNPYSKTSPGVTTAHHSDYEIGDLSNKHGRLDDSVERNGEKVWDFNLPMFGVNSINDRSIVVHHATTGDRIACGDLKEPHAMTMNLPLKAYIQGVDLRGDVWWGKDGLGWTWTSGAASMATFAVVNHPTHTAEMNTIEGTNYDCGMAAGKVGVKHAKADKANQMWVWAFSTIVFYDGGDNVIGCGTFTPEDPVCSMGDGMVAVCEDSHCYSAINLPGRPAGSSGVVTWFITADCTGHSMTTQTDTSVGNNHWTWMKHMKDAGSWMVDGDASCHTMSSRTWEPATKSRKAHVPGIMLDLWQKSPFSPTKVCLKFNHHMTDPKQKKTKQAGNYHVHVDKVRFQDCLTTGGHFNPYSKTAQADDTFIDTEYEVGDLSGKHKRIDDFAQNRFKKEWYDFNLPLCGVASIKDRSVVFHEAAGPRLYCANWVDRAENTKKMREELNAGFRGETFSGKISQNPTGAAFTMNSNGVATHFAIANVPMHILDVHHSEGNIHNCDRAAEWLDGKNMKRPISTLSKRSASWAHAFQTIVFYNQGAVVACGTFAPADNVWSSSNGIKFVCNSDHSWSAMAMADADRPAGTTGEVKYFTNDDCTGFEKSYWLSMASDNDWTTVKGMKHAKSWMVDGGVCHTTASHSWSPTERSVTASSNGYSVMLWQGSPFCPTKMTINADADAGAQYPLVVGKFHVHSNALSGSTDCNAAGGHFNPYAVPTPFPDSQDEVHQNYEVGDLSRKHGTIESPEDRTDQVTWDFNLPLRGVHSVHQKSVVFHESVNGGKMYCADFV